MMKRLIPAAMTAVVALVQGQQAFSLPPYGADCTSCHTGARGTMTIASGDTTGNPVEACGLPDRGSLNVFQVIQGGTKRLTGTVSGLASGAKYAAVIEGFETAGAEHCGALTWTGDASWNQQSSTTPVYYSQPLSGTSFTWPGTATFNFDITVGADTPPDFYDLVLASAGKDATGRFYTDAHFYVQVVAARPTIALNKSGVVASAAPGASPADESFTVANSGQGTLQYTIASDAAWVSASPASGSSTGPANSHALHYSTAALAPGNYAARITVTDANATNNPQTISVSLTVTAPPTGSGPPGIALSKASVAPAVVEGASPANDSFTVVNSGEGTLNYTVSCNVPWLSVSPASGSSTGAANTHTLQYSTAALAAGTYPATITVSDAGATNNPQTISVSLKITKGTASIVLSASTLAASAGQASNAPDDSFTVKNGGQGTLNYTITSNASWLAVLPGSGASTGTANSHTVRYTTWALTPGSYSGSITVSDAGAGNTPQTIKVNLTITSSTPPPSSDNGSGKDASGSAVPTGSDNSSDPGAGASDQAAPVVGVGGCGAGAAGVVPALLLALACLRIDFGRKNNRPINTN